MTMMTKIVQGSPYGDTRAALNGLLAASRVVNGLVVQIGDSIGAGTLTGGYTAINKLAFPAAVTINNGFSISGRAVTDIPADVPNGLVSLYDPAKPNVVVIQRGANDLGNNSQSAAATYSALSALVAQYKGQGFYVGVCTLLPRTGTAGNWNVASKGPILTAYNDLVKANNAGADLVIDLNGDPIIGGASASSNTNLYSDGLHLTSVGQDYVATDYRASIAQLLNNAARAPTLLSTLSLSSTVATAGATFSAAIAGKTYGSTITASSSDGTTLSVSGTTVSGIFPAAGSPRITLVETLAGASGSPQSPQFTITVAAGSGSGSGSGSGTAIDPLSLSGAGYGAMKFGQGLIAGTATVPTTVVANGHAYPFTAECWVTTTSTGGVTVAMGSAGSWWLGTRNNNAGASVVAGGSFVDINTSVVINDGNPHHVALVMTSSGTSFYVDGALAGSVPATPDAQAGAVSIRTYNNGFGWGGGVDEVAFFTTARYTSTFTPPGSAYASGTAGLIGVYHLNGDGTGMK